MPVSIAPSVTVALSALLGLGFALYLTPIIIAAAERYGIVDRPNGGLKRQARPVPYLGGLALFLSVLAAVAIANPLSPQVLAILLAASIIVAFGLVDDLGTLVPKDKLFGQIIAASVLVRAGVSIQIEALPEPMGAVISVFWLVTIINAFNIIDVHDGLSAGVGAVATLFFGIFALLSGQLVVAVMSAALFGALLGFLRFNFSPAQVYLGDTGSMLIGLLLGALAMISSYSTVNPVAPLFSPLAVLVVPLFDLGFVVLARLAHRIPIYHGSPDHFAVRLSRRGSKASHIALGAYSAGAIAGGLALVAAYASLAVALGVIALTTVSALGVLLWLWRMDPRALEPPASAAEQAALSTQKDLTDDDAADSSQKNSDLER